MKNSLAHSCMRTGKVLHNGEYWYAIDDCLIARVIPRIPPKTDAAPDAEGKSQEREREGGICATSKL